MFMASSARFINRGLSKPLKLNVIHSDLGDSCGDNNTYYNKDYLYNMHLI